MDSQTLRKFYEGDAQVFNTLMQEYQQPLYYYLYRMVGNAEDAQDLLQETFVKAYTKRKSFRGDAQVQTWLYSIAGNLAKNHLRWRSIRRFVNVEESEHLIPEDEVNPTEVDEMEQELFQYVQQLPERQRSVFILKYFHGLQHQEIAHILDISEGSSKTNFHYATKTLQALIQGDER